MAQRRIESSPLRRRSDDAADRSKQVPGTLACRAIVQSLFLAILLYASAGRGMAEQGYYRVTQSGGVWWFVGPDGMPFFSLGVDVTDRGSPREKYDSKKPEYAAFRQYPDTAAWARSVLTRLRAWNFNTLGAWCDVKALVQAGEKPLPYTIELELGGSLSPGVPWCDLFSPEIERKLDTLVRAQVLPLKNDPHLLGYFTDNELGWWGDTLFLYFLKQPPTNATRQMLMRLLRVHYHADFTRLQRDFDTGGVRSFDALERRAPLTLLPGGHGMVVVDQFIFRLAQRYYRLTHDAIRRYDPHHLILGDRYASWCPQSIIRAASDYVDVISTNYGADWTDGGNARFFLDSLHRLAKKPVLITEFYFCAMENRSGNKNSSAGFPTVQTQRERAKGFRANLTAFLSQPYIVGAHWFQYYDEPSQGRKDGENYNMGLVDIEDKPYEELTAAVTGLQIPALHRLAALPPAVGESVVPPAPEKPEQGLRVWDKHRAFLNGAAGVAPSLPFGDLYACWEADYLYLAVYAADYLDAKLYSGGVIPQSERMELSLRLDGSKRPLRIRFGPGGKATVEGAAVRLHEWPGLKSTVLLALPASLLGKPALKSGETVRLQATLASHSRAERMTWTTTLRLGTPIDVPPSSVLEQKRETNRP